VDTLARDLLAISGGIMSKKFIPKYPTTWSEFDSDDITHLLNSLQRYEHKEETKKIVFIALVIALIIAVPIILRSIP